MNRNEFIKSFILFSSILFIKPSRLFASINSVTLGKKAPNFLLNGYSKISPNKKQWSLNDFSKKWMNFKIVISKIINEKGFVTIFINDKIVFDKVVHFPKRGTPRIKYGIYRPGNLQGNNTSQILYSKINVNSKK